MRARSLLLGHVKVKSGLHLDGRHNILLEPLILTKRGGLECVEPRRAHMVYDKWKWCGRYAKVCIAHVALNSELHMVLNTVSPQQCSGLQAS